MYFCYGVFRLCWCAANCACVVHPCRPVALPLFAHASPVVFPALLLCSCPRLSFAEPGWGCQCARRIAAFCLVWLCHRCSLSVPQAGYYSGRGRASWRQHSLNPIGQLRPCPLRVKFLSVISTCFLRMPNSRLRQGACAVLHSTGHFVGACALMLVVGGCYCVAVCATAQCWHHSSAAVKWARHESCLWRWLLATPVAAFRHALCLMLTSSSFVVLSCPSVALCIQVVALPHDMRLAASAPSLASSTCIAVGGFCSVA